MFTFIFTDIKRMECTLGDLYESPTDCKKYTRSAAVEFCAEHAGSTVVDKPDGHAVYNNGKVIAAFVYCTLKLGLEE